MQKIKLKGREFQLDESGRIMDGGYHWGSLSESGCIWRNRNPVATRDDIEFISENEEDSPFRVTQEQFIRDIESLS